MFRFRKWQDIREHSQHGAHYLSRGFALAVAAEVVLYGHERIDGGGYPSGLAGSAITYGARIIAVAGSFDAMTAGRPYRPVLPVDRARSILREGAGTQWDRDIVTAFLNGALPRFAKPEELEHE